MHVSESHRSLAIPLVVAGALYVCPLSPAALSAQVAGLARGAFAVPRGETLRGADEPEGCNLPSSPPEEGARWFPDSRLVHARSLTRGAAVLALGEAAISIPIAKGADKLGAAQSGAALMDGHIPVPGKQESVVLCEVDENGVLVHNKSGPKDSVTRFTRTLVRIRLVANFPVEQTADSKARAQREERAITEPEGGLVNVQLSRYVFGWQRTGFAALVRASVGAGIHQVSDTGAGNAVETSYKGLVYAGLQGSVQIPVEPLINGARSQLILAVEPFARSLPEELRPSFEGKRSFRGLALRGVALRADKAGIGLTYRTGIPRVPESTRWSIELLYLK